MRRPWRDRASTLVPAVVAGAALALPWTSSSGPVHVIDGPSVTNTGEAVRTAFELLAVHQLVAIVLAVLVTAVVAVVSPERTWWAAGVTAMVACVVSLLAFARLGAAVGPVVLSVAAAALLARVGYEFVGGRMNAVSAVALLMVAAVTMWIPEWSLGVQLFPRVIAGQFDASARLVPVNGDVAVAHAGEVALVEGDRLTPLLRVVDRDVTVLGAVGDRLVYYRADAFEVRIVPLTGGRPAVLTDVIGVDSMTVTGKVLLRTAGAPLPVLRRLDVGAARGRANADTLDPAPVPGIRPLLETDDESQPMRFQEHPRTGQIVTVDNNELHRAVLVGADPGARRWQPLTGPGGHRDCFGAAPGASPLATADVLAPDGVAGWWLHDGAGTTLVHVGGDGYVRTGDLPAVPRAFMADRGNTFYLLADDGLWRTSDVTSQLAAPWRAPHCLPHPTVAKPVRLEPVAGDGPVATEYTVPDGSGGTWRLAYDASTYKLEHRDAGGGVLARQAAPGVGGRLWVDLSGGVPFVGACPPARLVEGLLTPPARIPAGPADQCWDGLAIAPDGRGWALLDGKLYSFGQEGVVAVTNGEIPGDPVAVRLGRGEPVESLPLRSASLALDRDGRPLVLVEDVLLGLSDQGKPVVLGQDERLRGMTLVTAADGVLAVPAIGRPHRLGY